MTGTFDSVIVREDMNALEYHEAAWKAHDLDVKAPDPLRLSDRALRAIVQYELADLPVEAREAVEAERGRRMRFLRGAERFAALAMMVVLGISGVLIGWILLAS